MQFAFSKQMFFTPFKHFLIVLIHVSYGFPVQQFAKILLLLEDHMPCLQNFKPLSPLHSDHLFGGSSRRFTRRSEPKMTLLKS